MLCFEVRIAREVALGDSRNLGGIRARIAMSVLVIYLRNVFTDIISSAAGLRTWMACLAFHNSFLPPPSSVTIVNSSLRLCKIEHEPRLP